MNVNETPGIGSSARDCQVDAGLPLLNSRVFSRKSSMCLRALLAAELLSSAAAVADVAVKIDPVKNCLDTSTGTFPFVEAAVGNDGDTALIGAPPVWGRDERAPGEVYTFRFTDRWSSIAARA